MSGGPQACSERVGLEEHIDNNTPQICRDRTPQGTVTASVNSSRQDRRTCAEDVRQGVRGGTAEHACGGERGDICSSGDVLVLPILAYCPVSRVVRLLRRAELRFLVISGGHRAALVRHLCVQGMLHCPSSAWLARATLGCGLHPTSSSAVCWYRRPAPRCGDGSTPLECKEVGESRGE